VNEAVCRQFQTKVRKKKKYIRTISIFFVNEVSFSKYWENIFKITDERMTLYMKT
jgi:hypothetical protein